MNTHVTRDCFSPVPAFLPRFVVLVLSVLCLALVPLSAKEKPAKKAKAYEPAGLHPREPQLRIDFPGGARTRAATSGWATLSVAVGADGKARDFLVTSYTDPAFGKALEDKARTLEYQAARLNGTPVPGRVELRYDFDIGDIAMTNLEAANNRNARPKPVFAITKEEKLDEKLEFASVSLPRLPAGYKPADGNPLRVMVTFFIDTEGAVRCPQAESAPTPELATAAMDAVSLWSFKPPTAKGAPALVLKAASVRFNPAADPQ